MRGGWEWRNSEEQQMWPGNWQCRLRVSVITTEPFFLLPFSMTNKALQSYSLPHGNMGFAKLAISSLLLAQKAMFQKNPTSLYYIYLKIMLWSIIFPQLRVVNHWLTDKLDVLIQDIPCYSCCAFFLPWTLAHKQCALNVAMIFWGSSVPEL